MSSAVTRAGQKWKEFWGQSITTNPVLEERKQEVNQLNNYFQMADRTLVSMSQCHAQLQTLYNQCAMIATKIYEHEIGHNKVLGTNLIKMFHKISELHGEKVNPLYTLKNELKPWFDTIEQLKILMERYQEDRLVYDHYKLKVKDLSNSKDASKIQRNEGKLEKASSKYQNLCIDMQGKMEHIMQNKYIMMNSVFAKLIQFESEVSLLAAENLQECLNFQNQFQDGDNNNNQKVTQEVEQKNDNSFINNTRKLLNQSKASTSQIEQQQPKQTKQEQNKNEPDPFEEFNRVSVKFAQEFDNAESPALCKDQKQQSKQQLDMKQQQQKLQEQQEQYYQAIKKERKQQNEQNQKPEQQAQNQQMQNPFPSQMPQQPQNQMQEFRPSQSMIVQSSWNPFDDQQANPPQQNFKKSVRNPFDDEVDDSYVPQNQPQNQQQQSQSQIFSARQTNPFFDQQDYQEPQARMFQTYQPSNPFQQKTQNTTSKNPFI